MSEHSRRKFMAALGAGSAVAVGSAAGLTEWGTTSARAATDSKGLSKILTTGPNDPQYADITSGYNNRWTAQPEQVRFPTTTAQVVAAVQEAVDGGKKLTVRSGGHCYEDFVYNAEVEVIIDMTYMNEVTFDENRSAFMIEPGVKLREMYELLYRGWGVTLPSGYCPLVAAGGQVTGGGVGMYSRSLGLTVDNMYAVEVVVVDADGKVRSVVATREKDDPNHDLWWACAGGGGGNFGIITRYWMRAPGATGRDPQKLLPVPSEHVLTAHLVWPWDKVSRKDLGNLINAHGQWHLDNSDEGNEYRKLGSYLSFFPGRTKGRIELWAYFDGADARSEQLIKAYMEDMNKAVGGDTRTPVEVQRQTYLRTYQLNAGRGDVFMNPTLRGEHRSAYLRKPFTETQIDGLYRNMVEAGYENEFDLAWMVLTSLGGKVGDVAADATAFPQRDAIFQILWEIHWFDEADDDPHISWTRQIYSEMYKETGGVPVPDDVNDGCYINYPDSDVADPAWNKSDTPWHELYYKDNYPKLQQAKAKWDPKDFFNHRLSIRLPK
ncbi:FAD-binding protein [Streptomyces sp. LHD-70]|uniref:FAD-binding oxidoreductase n=1 Tax=Streptomyces sp. LHD-70 TaxID=3072140 RepID=UPI00280C776E|nr:FAD-binding protein [Streptomyces sp. LHD-70]MDQ8706191.1 FAD-binding protein [Streptomyces sp. LHD-70]